MCPREPRCKIRCLFSFLLKEAVSPYVVFLPSGPAEAVSWWREKYMNPPHWEGKTRFLSWFWIVFPSCLMNLDEFCINFIPLHDFGWSIFFPGVRRFCPGSAAKALLRTPCGHHPFNFKWRSMMQMMQTKNETWNNWSDYPVIWEFFCFCFLLFSSPGDSRKHRSFLYQLWVVGTHVMYACLEDEALAILRTGRKVCKQHIVALKALTNAEFLKSQQV